MAQHSSDTMSTLVGLLLALLFVQTHTFSMYPRLTARTSTRTSRLEMKAPGGKIVVSGIGSVEEDEFMLNLLNEQVCFAPQIDTSVTVSSRYLPFQFTLVASF